MQKHSNPQDKKPLHEKSPNSIYSKPLLVYEDIHISLYNMREIPPKGHTRNCSSGCLYAREVSGR